MAQNQHVVPREQGWAVRGAGNSYDTSKHFNRLDAIEAAKRIAILTRSDVIIHAQNGKIKERLNYH